MKNLKQTVDNYHIHGFMRDIGLKGNILNLYAILYSFTVGPSGIFYGSKHYLAKALGVCPRTVTRGLLRLKSMGLIEYTSVNGKTGILAKAPEKRNETQKNTAPEQYNISEIDRISLENEAARRLTEEEKALLEEERLLSAKKEGVAPDPWEANRDDIDLALGRIRRHTVTPKYTVLPLGLNARVMLTDEQYQRLILIGGDQIADIYIQRLDDMLSDPKSYNKSPHSHYKTLKRWMEEDLRT